MFYPINELNCGINHVDFLKNYVLFSTVNQVVFFAYQLTDGG